MGIHHTVNSVKQAVLCTHVPGAECVLVRCASTVISLLREHLYEIFVFSALWVMIICVAGIDIFVLYCLFRLMSVCRWFICACMQYYSVYVRVSICK